jgi:hypothetical protein
VLTNRIWSSAQLIDARNLAVAEAGDLVRSGTFTSSDLCSVRNAYAAVGLGSGDRDCDTIEDNVDPDQDGDYIANNVDNCATVFNPFQNDLDGDGQGDACDSDMDGDGRANNQDNCSTVFNPGQQDWNLDGAGDVCDDTDGDSITDNRDNCRTIWNFDQKDQDFDGIGDACDSDIDGDGWGNTWDNCPIHRNPGQEDTTETAIGQPKDGIGNVCDLCPAVSSTDNTDLDGDGLANPCDPDDDGDGWDDGLDNCPVNANPTQFDWDKNGVGFVCDANEQKKFGDLLSDINNRYAVQLSDFHMPIPICPECVGNYLPHDFQSVINVQLPVAFKAQVVHSNGVVVAKGVGSSLNQSLWVSPVSFALTPQFGPRAVQRSQNPALAAEPAPDETFYYLEIVPEPGTDLSQTNQLGISVQGEVKGHKSYLPRGKK